MPSWLAVGGLAHELARTFLSPSQVTHEPEPKWPIAARLCGFHGSQYTATGFQTLLVAFPAFGVLRLFFLFLGGHGFRFRFRL